jgi:amino acid adenylation domain-containing protein
MAFSLYHLLAQATQHRPEGVALRFNGQDLTFGELHRRSSTIGRLLLEQGLQRQDRVAVYMSRGFDTTAAIYGIMQAGGVYVPFDSYAPVGRLSAILRDCDVRYLITEEAKREQFEQIAADYPHLQFVIGLESGPGLPEAHLSWASLEKLGALPAPDVRVIEQDLCLIFYTSGSTGNPKGAAHSHRSMLSNVEWAQEKFKLNSQDRFIHVTSHHFDLSWFEMYASMAAQGTLVLAPEQAVRFPANLADLASREKLSVWCSVPSVLMQLAQRGDLTSRDFSNLRLITFAGERFPTRHLKHLMNLLPGIHYCNMYGTTETHIAAYWDVPPLPEDFEEAIPIGRGVEHVNLMAVDAQGRRVAPQETGELVVRGPSLMEGYWKLPERNAKALVKLRFSPELEGLCYRTGDLVIQQPDGNFTIIGRADRRVKVRGNLVDLDEVEKVLWTNPQVQEAAAFLVNGEEESAHIEAAVIARPGSQPTSAELRVHVSRVLPTYAVPERVAVVADFPRTGSGKMSRKDLPAIVSQNESALPGAARTAGDPVANFIQTELLSGRNEVAFTEDLDLLDSGLMDSIGVIRLVSFIEETYKIQIPNDEFVSENFTSLKSIHSLVARLS